MLEVIRTPELAAEVTLLPIDSFGFDAAIVFSDILPPLVGMGLELDFVKGDGPRIGNPISTHARRRPPRNASGGGDDDRDARGDPHRSARARGAGRSGHRLRRRAVHARELRDRRRDLQGLHEDEGVHALRARRVEAPPREARHGAGGLPARAGGGRRAGAAGVRLVGGSRARARGLPALRRAAQPRAVREGRRGRCAGDQLLARRERVPVRGGRRAAATSSGSTGRFRSTRRGSASASTGPCREISIRRRCWRRGGSCASASTTCSSGLPAGRGTSSTSATASRRRRPSTTCGGSSSTCGSRRPRESAAPDRRARHGVRRAGFARRDPRLPRGHPPRAPDAARGARGDHRELPRDRRKLAAPRASLGARSTRCKPSSGTATAATSACGTGRRGSRTSSARWPRTA